MKILTFEYEKTQEALHINTNSDGLRYLASELLKLADQVEKQTNDHIHLMTEEWGGHELNSQAQSKTSEIINHVKIFGWES